MTSRRIALGGALLTVGLAACGDTGPSDAKAADRASGPEAATVEVVASDLAFDADTYDAATGSVTIDYRNEGNIPHTLVIEDVDGFKLEVPTNGATDEGSTDLQPGRYVLYCDIPGHRAAGMEATLRVG
jgi:plastocyanin